MDNFLAVGNELDSNGLNPLANSFLTSSCCFRDIRINNFNIPLKTDDDTFAGTTKSRVNTETNCLPGNNCVRNPCPTVKPICTNKWRHFTCSCREGDILLNNGTCLPYDGCTMEVHQCKNKAVCKWDSVNGTQCQCPAEWKGRFCDVPIIIPTLKPFEASFPWHFVLLIALVTLIILLVVLVVIFIPRFKSEEKEDDLATDFDGLEKVNETLVNYQEEGAGEEDYSGPLGVLPTLGLVSNAVTKNPSAVAGGVGAISAPKESRKDDPAANTLGLQRNPVPISHDASHEGMPDETLAYEFESDKLGEDNSVDYLSQLDGSTGSDDDNGSLDLNDLAHWGNNFRRLANHFNVI